MEYTYALIIAFVVAVVGGFPLVLHGLKAKKLGTGKTIQVGKYITGLESALSSTIASCAITDNDFVFIGTFGSELGKIPRDSIVKISVEDTSQLSKRLTTVTRMALFGPFSLAMPKVTKHNQYWLVIDWEDANGVLNNTIFEYSGIGCKLFANQAANQLRKEVRPKSMKLKDDQKKCPYCAEIIKKEAKLCRFCKSTLD